MPPWHTLKSLECGKIPPLIAQEFGVAVEELSQAQSVYSFGAPVFMCRAASAEYEEARGST